MDKIRNIIFDLGGVVIDLDRNKAVEALSRLGVEDVNALLGEYEQQGAFRKLETGEISAAEFFDILLPLCKNGTSCADIASAFEEFLVDLPKERLHALDELRKKGYKLYVLSNTNPVMYGNWIKKAFQQEGKTVNDYFDGIVVSFQEGMCKPEPSLFQRVVDRYSLKPEETLMLDDSPANVESARSIGLKAIRITPSGSDSFDSVTSSL